MTPQAVLDFWFGAETPRRARPQWFAKDAAFDADIGQRFGAAIQSALSGECDHWQRDAESALARILLLDQFTRNTGRGSAAAFAGDALALDGAQLMVKLEHDLALDPVARAFVYLPFEHAESLQAQDEAVRLFTGLAQAAPEQAGMLEWAHKHRDVINRFGRFPHRNEALGRVSTAAEASFLKEPGSSF